MRYFKYCSKYCIGNIFYGKIIEHPRNHVEIEFSDGSKSQRKGTIQFILREMEEISEEEYTVVLVMKS